MLLIADDVIVCVMDRKQISVGHRELVGVKRLCVCIARSVNLTACGP